VKKSDCSTASELSHGQCAKNSFKVDMAAVLVESNRAHYHAVPIEAVLETVNGNLDKYTQKNFEGRI